jgi:hypothetical protein
MLRAMFVRALFRVVVLIGLALPFSFLVGCSSGGPGDAKHATIKPGDMPEGGDWSGVYYSPFYGYLHLVKEGDSATGAWRTAAGEKWGEVSGKINGNVLRFEWTEHTIGMVGPTATRSGKGYFRYTVPKQAEAHEIVGEIGQGADEVGEPWKAVKQMNMTPNPKSVIPDETERHSPGGGWDNEKAPGGGEGSEKKEGESSGEGEGSGGP